MEKEIIFADGYSDDLESTTRDLRTDVLIRDIRGNFYNPTFTTIERITNMFDVNETCYLDDNLVFLHSVTKDNIFKAISELYEWKFYNRWVPLTEAQLIQYFYPKEKWVIFKSDVSANE